MMSVINMGRGSLLVLVLVLLVGRGSGQATTEAASTTFVTQSTMAQTTHSSKPLASNSSALMNTTEETLNTTFTATPLMFTTNSNETTTEGRNETLSTSSSSQTTSMVTTDSEETTTRETTETHNTTSTSQATSMGTTSSVEITTNQTTEPVTSTTPTAITNLLETTPDQTTEPVTSTTPVGMTTATDSPQTTTENTTEPLTSISPTAMMITASVPETTPDQTTEPLTSTTPAGMMTATDSPEKTTDQTTEPPTSPTPTAMMIIATTPAAMMMTTADSTEKTTDQTTESLTSTTPTASVITTTTPAAMMMTTDSPETTTDQTTEPPTSTTPTVMMITASVPETTTDQTIGPLTSTIPAVMMTATESPETTTDQTTEPPTSTTPTAMMMTTDSTEKTTDQTTESLTSNTPTASVITTTTPAAMMMTTDSTETTTDQTTESLTSTTPTASVITTTTPAAMMMTTDSTETTTDQTPVPLTSTTLTARMTVTDSQETTTDQTTEPPTSTTPTGTTNLLETTRDQTTEPLTSTTDSPQTTTEETTEALTTASISSMTTTKETTTNVPQNESTTKVSSTETNTPGSSSCVCPSTDMSSFQTPTIPATNNHLATTERITTSHDTVSTPPTSECATQTMATTPVEVDECIGNNHTCHPSALCVDTVYLYECVCPPGYSGNGTYCKDVDECLDNSDLCHEDAQCYNTDGSYSCACMGGYGGDGFNCTDIDQCEEGTHHCHLNATCTNLIGMDQYNCSCDHGFHGDGFMCEDIDECGDPRLHDCTHNETCTNTMGGYKCVCNEGYIEQGSICIDIDQCEEGTHHCHLNATCTNLIGMDQYNCSCDHGFHGDGFVCEDIDECGDPRLHDCTHNETCTNTMGGYKCVCNEGYIEKGSICIDVDDCANVTCWNSGVCVDGLGSYRCDCQETFIGEHCEIYQSEWGDWSPWSEDCEARYVNYTAVEARIRTRTCQDRADLHGAPSCEGTGLEWQLCEIGREARNFSHLFQTVSSPIQPGYEVHDIVLDLRGLSLEDSDGNVRFEILWSDEGKFVLEDNGLLKVSEMLDPNRAYGLTIVSIDNSTEPSALLHIYNVLIDVNHTEWIYDKTGCPHVTLETEVEEEKPNGTTVAHLATELNGDETTRYFLRPGPYSEFVYVDEFTGIVSTSQSLDREETRSFWFDAVVVNHTSTAIVTVNVEITDINDHPPIFQNTPVWGIISSDAPALTIVAVVKATDEDDGTNGMVEYELMSYNDAFQITATDGIIRVKDTESLPSDLLVEISVRARDLGSVQRSTDAHRAVDLTIVSSSLIQIAVVESIEENIPVGTIVANFSDKLQEEDPEESPRNYRFILQDDGSGQAQQFSLGNTTGILRTAADIDRESNTFQGRYTFTVVAYEEGSCDGRLISVAINVTDINDNTPVFSSQTYVGHIAENAEADAAVLFPNNQVPQATDADFGINGTVTYDIQSSHNTATGMFSIDPQTAAIYVSFDAAFDRESRAQYNFVVTATDRGGGAGSRTGTATVTINIDDINDNEPILESTVNEYNISEHVSGGFLITTLSATDADQGTNAEIVYTLEGGDRLFNVHPTTGELEVTSGHLDAETTNRFTLNISAHDLGSPPQTGTQTVTINILDFNDNAPVFLQSVYKFSVSEDIEVGGTIGNLSATDADITEQNSDIRYKILNGVGPFYVDSFNGAVVVNETLDYEEGQTYFEFEVEAQDTGIPALTGKTSILQIDITDANDNRPIISDINHNYSLLATAPEGSIVTVVQALDIDSGNNGKVTFAINSTRESFSIDEDTGIVKLNHQLENVNEVTSVVTATDNGEKKMSSNFTLVVQIVEPETGVTLDPLNFKNDTYTIDVTENISGDVPILNVSIAEEGLTYAILPESPLFKVDEQGVIHTRSYRGTSLLDRETSERHVLVIVAKDTSGRQASAPVVVNVLDVNDEPPVFSEGGVIFEVAEGDDSVGSTVGTVSAADRDAGLNGTVEYHIIDGNADRDLGSNADVEYRIISERSFHVGAGGSIFTSRKLDRETKDVYSFLVEAYNPDAPHLSNIATVNITVNDVNDNPPHFTTLQHETVTIPEDTKTGTSVFQVSAEDRDGNDVSYRLTGGSCRELFSIDGTSGEISVNQRLDSIDRREEVYSCSIEVTADDDGVPSLNTTIKIAINITAVNYFWPEFETTFFNVTVRERLEWGEDVEGVLLNATDSDEGRNGVVKLEITDTSHEGLFNVTSEGQLIVNVPELDREPDNDHVYVIVSAYDMGTPRKYANVSATVNITILDINDNVPVPDSDDIELSIPQLFYVFVENSVDFEGDVNELEIHKIKVKVNVMSTNRHAPTFTKDHYELHVNDSLLPRGHIFENVSVKATDDDSGSDGEIVYSFEDRTCQAFWYVLTIDPWNGTILIDNTLGEEESNRYCTIYAVDRGNPQKRRHLQHPVDGLTPARPGQEETTPSVPRGGTLPPLQRDMNAPQRTLGPEKEKRRKKKRRSKIHPECRSDRDSGISGSQDDGQSSFKSWPDSPKAWTDSSKTCTESSKGLTGSPKTWTDSPKPWTDSPKAWAESLKVHPNDVQSRPGFDYESRGDSEEEIDSDVRPVYEYDTEATTDGGSMLSL
ncbi:PREDICTED: protocadherin Fat 4-like [Branchiostoma belcheri]|uniref:Protocadherin Fat 4-like n=1 Tax=Branchiostoma belcheri TaxID=7741 RepID=A0A6P5A4Z8_BRABE|nr:PREDICTED: protocadherin Fat 4-like [Branchiostoma belcheri]